MKTPLLAAMALFALAFLLAVAGKWQERQRRLRHEAIVDRRLRKRLRRLVEYGTRANGAPAPWIGRRR